MSIHRGLACRAVAHGEGGAPHQFSPMSGAHKRMHANRRQALQFRYAEIIGRWIRGQCPLSAAAGELTVERPCRS